MQTRTDLINFLIKKHGYKRYLEIGVQNTAQNFDKIEVEYKVCVDPDPKAKASYLMTSDEFFENCKSFFMNEMKFDIIFIDGMHTAEQVKKDFENSIYLLSEGGSIILHDCNPLKEEYTIVPRPKPTGNWHGDVYKFVSRIPKTNIISGIPKNQFYTVNIDCGCGVYFGGIDGISRHRYKSGLLTWQMFDKNRNELLNLIEWDDFIKL
jgi:hypothetical protein